MSQHFPRCSGQQLTYLMKFLILRCKNTEIISLFLTQLSHLYERLERLSDRTIPLVKENEL